MIVLYMNDNQYVFYKNILCNLGRNCKFKSLLNIYQQNKSLYNYNKLKFFISSTIYNKASSYQENGILHTLLAEFCYNNEIFYNSYTSNTYGQSINTVPSKAKLYKTINCNNLTIKLYDYC